MNILKYYSTPIIICLTSIAFGLALIIRKDITSNGLVLFLPPQDFIVGVWMVFTAVSKLFTLNIKPNFLKKWAMIGVLVGWTVVSYGYLTNPVDNRGYILTIPFVVLSIIELYRGDYIVN